MTDQFYDSFKTMIQVDSQNDKGINLIIEDDGRYPEIASRWIEPEYKYEQLFGIPLTPEMLEKCGFEHVPELHEYADKNHTIYQTVDDTWCMSIFCSTDCKVKLTYLHQLQNLYHALTGEELPFKEK